MRLLRMLASMLFLALIALPAALTYVTQNQPATEAPAGFDNQTNGFAPQDQFDADRATFNEREFISDGLGPVYNAQSCNECHQSPVTGAVSQVLELRAGHFNSNNFIDHPGGSLIHSRAIDAGAQESILDGNEVRMEVRLRL